MMQTSITRKRSRRAQRSSWKSRTRITAGGATPVATPKVTSGTSVLTILGPPPNKPLKLTAEQLSATDPRLRSGFAGVGRHGINAALSSELRFWIGYAGIAIFAWTAFLVWGSRRPGERKFVAIPTVGVVLGFVIAEIVGIFQGTVSAINMAPLLAMQLILIALLLIGYRRA